MSLEFIQANSQGFLIGAGVVLAIGIIWLFMLKFAFREKSFEEVVEEQRKRLTQEELMSKQEKVKKDKEKEKKHKKWGKRKEKTEQNTDNKIPEPTLAIPESISVSETGDEIEVIEPKEVLPKKKQSKQPQKPAVAVVQNNATANVASSVTVPPTKAPEAPKQVVETVKPTEKKEKVTSNSTKDKEKPKIEAKASVETQKMEKPVEAEIVVNTPVQQPVQVSQPVAPVANKKKKKTEQSDKTDISNVTASSLISMVKEAALGDLESQMLIEVLLNKQKEAASWKKQASKDSQAQMVKKQQQEKDLLEANQTSTKLKQELGQEKAKMSAMEKVLQDKIAFLQQEVQTYANRLKQVQELHASEKAAAQEKIVQIEKDAETKMVTATKKFEEEKAQFLKTIKKLESESKSNHALTELETIKKSRDDLQKVHTLLVEQHTQMIVGHKTETKTLNAQIADAKKLLQESQDKNSALQKEIESIKKKQGDFAATKKTVDEHKKKAEESEAALKRVQILLDEAEKKVKDSNGKLEMQLNRVAELTKENSELKAEIEGLQVEVERLSSELAVSNERVAGDGQEMLQQNGELDVKKELEQQLADEKEKILQEKEQRLSQLYDDLNACKVKITSLSEELEQQKHKNNELREKNWKAVEALGAAEQKAKDAQKDAEERIQEVQEIQQKLKQLQKIQENSSSAVSQEISQRLSDTEKQLEKLQAELDDSLRKYKLEVDKNSNSTAELQNIQLQKESLEKRVSEMQLAVTDLKSEVSRTQQSCRSCLLRLFPAVNINSTLPHDEWLLQFEQQALNVINAASSSGDEVMAQLLEESSALKEKVSHYEVVLAETEAMLNKLQDSAKITESEWEGKLHHKELELQKVTDELQSVMAEKERLSAVSAELSRLEELDTEVKSLQHRLEVSENEKLSFQQKYDEVNKNYINVKDQIDSKSKLVEDLQKEVSSFDHVRKELEDIKSKLEKEKKINKDFSAQMVRLNSLVKIGQDSLIAEQETVKKLQNQLSQLQAAQVTTANGTSIPSAVEVNESQAKSVKHEKLKKSKKSDASGKK